MNDVVSGALRSRTMLLNGVVTVAGLTDVVLSASGVIAAVAPQLSPWLAVLGAINMALRAVTTQSLSDKGRR